MVPEPAPVPPEPETEDKPSPRSGIPPIPPEPENLAATRRLIEGLLFYAPLDEDQSELTGSDLSAGERHLDLASALPGELGQVEMACLLEEGSDGMTSEARPLPELKAITISFWIRRQEPPAPEPPAGGQDPGKEPQTKEPAKAEPPANLVSVKGYCDVRLEEGQVVANLDRMGSEARLVLPVDKRWHHVLVENGEGSTTIWIDHLSHSGPVAETLAAVPEGNVAVQIGGGGPGFYIDEVAIWNRRFTPDERQVLYRLGRLGSPILMPSRAIAYWGFDEKSNSRLFQDAAGGHVLGAYKSWKPVKGIAPDPVPLTRKPNPRAAQVWHVAERPEEAGSFGMKPDAPFTYEG
ncbi:MAG: LamG domain-containing protein, partial [Akkermansiaceae bacterium]|nr:LamG domain-containing protein [Akkermansiaceae bacterium]